MNPDFDEEIKEFVKSLTQTILWCTSCVVLTDPKNSLRNFQPSYLVAPDLQVSDVSSDKYFALLRANVKSDQPVKDLCGGRLIAFEPSQSLSDGAAEQASNGYFDSHNCPPPDTWVWFVYYEGGYQRVRHEYSSGYLIAWVPPQFLELVNAGIWVIPEQCVERLDRYKSPFAEELRTRGWI
jgi:hypothetical protein